MSIQLLDHIDYLATFDDQRREIRDGAILIDGNTILWVGASADKPDVAVTQTHDLRGHVVMPGMVNTHHHMYQNLTRVMAQDDELFT